jgi:hypothetical protein
MQNVTLRPVNLTPRVEPLSRVAAIIRANQDEAQADDMRLIRRYLDRAEFSQASLAMLAAEEALAREGRANNKRASSAESVGHRWLG